MVLDINPIELIKGNNFIIALETPNDDFETYDEAFNFSKLLTSYIKRTASKKNYSCVGIISSAHHPTGFGEKVFDKKTGKIAHPSDLPDFKEPKEHRVYVLLVANPASDLKKHIFDYCRKRGKTMNDISGYKKRYYYENIKNVYRDSTDIQPINLFSDELNPWAYHFLRLITQVHYDMGNEKRLFSDYDCIGTKEFLVRKNKAVIFRGYVELDKDPSEWKNYAYLHTNKYKKVLSWDEDLTV